MKTEGFVSAFANWGEPNQVPILLFAKKNLVVDQSADAAAATANKFGNYSISHAYFEFATEADTFDTPAAEDTVDSVVSAAVAPRDILRCPLLTPPGTTTSDESRFASNVLTFFATTASAKPVAGIRQGFVNAAEFTDGCLIGGACLVASSGSQPSDLLYARIKFDSPIEKVAGFDIDLHWQITFSPPA